MRMENVSRWDKMDKFSEMINLMIKTFLDQHEGPTVSGSADILLVLLDDDLDKRQKYEWYYKHGK